RARRFGSAPRGRDRSRLRGHRRHRVFLGSTGTRCSVQRGADGTRALRGGKRAGAQGQPAASTPRAIRAPLRARPRLEAVSRLGGGIARLTGGAGVPRLSSVNLYEMDAKSLEGEAVRLDRFSGKVTLLVNVASECGYTPQYAGLERLHRQYAGRGFS